MSCQKYPLNDAVRGLSYSGLSLEDTFTQIYATGAWGKGSGAGSLPVHCLKWIEFLRKFIKEHQVKKVVDLGCGDWQFSPYIYHDLGVDYVGYDVVLPVIAENRARWTCQGFNFEHLEFSSNVDEIQDGELYILKDVLQHWSSQRIRSFLKKLLAKPSLRFILVCNCAEPEDWPDEDILDGGWRPLSSAKPPLNEFDAQSLLRFPSLPNLKEVCIISPVRKRHDYPQKAVAACTGTFQSGVVCNFAGRRAMHPVRRRRFDMVV
ncbi:AGX1 [Symbiodinium sp. CCMP2592]|nr:AGX1 [Symbiodinium sp. CCMP2592]